MSNTRTGAFNKLRRMEVVLVLLGVHVASVSTTHKNIQKARMHVILITPKIEK